MLLLISESSTLHSQTTRTSQPRLSKSILLRLSRWTALASFSLQNSRRVFGTTEFVHPCECQKHPCTKITVLYFGNTISGFPGRSFRCNRNRNPFRCNQLLTNSSGFVFFPLIAAMLRDRAAETGGSFSVARANELQLLSA